MVLLHSRIQRFKFCLYLMQFFLEESTNKYKNQYRVVTTAVKITWKISILFESKIFFTTERSDPDSFGSTTCSVLDTI